MDMFMDKLAQKLNAQEIIKANSAADAEELQKLKDRVAEYNECLERLQKLIQEGTAALQDSQAGSEDVNRCLERLQKLIQEVTAALQDSRAGSENVNRLVEEAVEKIRSIQQNNEGLDERFAAVDENTHKECVKVYRNVQAVVMEESGKQTEAAENASRAVNTLGGKVGAILGVSVAALVFSLASVVLQILSALNIQLF